MSPGPGAESRTAKAHGGNKPVPTCPCEGQLFPTRLFSVACSQHRRNCTRSNCHTGAMDRAEGSQARSPTLLFFLVMIAKYCKQISQPSLRAQECVHALPPPPSSKAWLGGNYPEGYGMGEV